MNKKRILAGLAAVLMTAVTLTACKGDSDKSSSEKSSDNAGESSDIAADASADADNAEKKGQTIKWLSYYDVNPSGNDSRSIALTLFEDVYGGKVEWVPTTNDTKYDDLANILLSGDSVDMFPYEWDAVPNGVSKNQYQPLDDYIDLNDELWAEMKDTADKMAYKGSHYVVPYSIDDPVCLIYSRKMMKDEGLDDPYELYQKDEWDWDVFMDMMKTFAENGGENTRYGCAGWIEQALMQSSGQTIVNYDGQKFTNNIDSPEIEAAEKVLEEICDSDLYSDSWYTYFPDDGSVLFCGIAPWALAESNGMNPDEDIFLVPFPKMPGSDKYYTSCSYGAKMLVAGSDKGEAVAEYIKCERLAVTEEQYVQAAKEKALTPEVNSDGEKTKFLTEEQWNAWQSMLDPKNITPVFDYGFGMGPEMTEETYDYSTRGTMLNLTDSVLRPIEGSTADWSEIRDSFKSAVDKAIEKYN